MPRLVQAPGFEGNPFEHCVAETEPNIAEYAVKPPYFEAIDARAQNTSSYVLFGIGVLARARRGWLSSKSSGVANRRASMCLLP
jgi:hypothetical protein